MVVEGAFQLPAGSDDRHALGQVAWLHATEKPRLVTRAVPYWSLTTTGCATPFAAPVYKPKAQACVQLGGMAGSDPNQRN